MYPGSIPVAPATLPGKLPHNGAPISSPVTTNRYSYHMPAYTSVRVSNSISLLLPARTIESRQGPLVRKSPALKCVMAKDPSSGGGYAAFLNESIIRETITGINLKPVVSHLNERR